MFFAPNWRPGDIVKKTIDLVLIELEKAALIL